MWQLSPLSNSNQTPVSTLCKDVFIQTHSLAPATAYDIHFKACLHIRPSHKRSNVLTQSDVVTSWRRGSCDDDGIPQWDGPILQMATRCNLSICLSLIFSPAARKKAFTRSASQAALRWVSWVLLAQDVGVFRCVLRPYLRGPPSARDNNNNNSHRNGPRLRRNVRNASHER